MVPEFRHEDMDGNVGSQDVSVLVTVRSACLRTVTFSTAGSFSPARSAPPGGSSRIESSRRFEISGSSRPRRAPSTTTSNSPKTMRSVSGVPPPSCSKRVRHDQGKCQLRFCQLRTARVCTGVSAGVRRMKPRTATSRCSSKDFCSVLMGRCVGVCDFLQREWPRGAGGLRDDGARGCSRLKDAARDRGPSLSHLGGRLRHARPPCLR